MAENKELFKNLPRTKADNLAEQYLNIVEQMKALQDKLDALGPEIIQAMIESNRTKINLRGKTLEPTMVSTKMKLKISKGTKV